jgi:hypothetical protein
MFENLYISRRVGILHAYSIWGGDDFTYYGSWI